ncbi:unnamed protein product, partial [Polarella glacialis]
YGTGAAIFSLAWHELLSRMTADGSFKPRRLIAVDPLGWNLSSHPRWTAGLDPDKAEEWFVESLEGWRSASGIERMDLVGHSIGGYLAASYAERHSNRVRILTLVSPAGVPKEPEDFRQKILQASWKIRLMLRLWGRGWTPHLGLQCLPKRIGYRIAVNCAGRWTQRSEDDTCEVGMDKDALADYIYFGWSEGAASSEMILGAILHPGAWAKRPLCDRLPKIRVPRIEMIYGDRDWMDARHGNAVAEQCQASTTTATATTPTETVRTPRIWVQLLTSAGHYGHLENVSGFVQALTQALGERDVGDEKARRSAELPPDFAKRFQGPDVPKWRSWEGYEFGR